MTAPRGRLNLECQSEATCLMKGRVTAKQFRGSMNVPNRGGTILHGKMFGPKYPSWYKRIGPTDLIT